MKFPAFHPCFLAVAAACVAALPGTGRAANFSYHVDVNVASLLGAAGNAPYAIDFQLNGDGLPAAGTNSVTLTNFVFTLGGSQGTPTLFGGAAGSLSSNVLLSLDSAHTANEFYQQFTGTTRDIQFDVNSTGNGSGITPDQFLVAILDKTTGQIATTAPDGVSLLVEPINGTVTMASIKTYSSTTPAGVVVSAVPEPGTFGAVLAGLSGLALVFRRKKN